MNAFTLFITVTLATVAAADEHQPAQTKTNTGANTTPAPAVETPTAEPLTLVGRGTELAIIENGELEQLDEAPPILILPESRGPAPPAHPPNTPQKTGNRTAEKTANTTTHNAGYDTLEEALEARRIRLGRKPTDAPPPPRGAGKRRHR